MRGLIERKGQTAEAFADEYGIARSTVFNWLKSETPPLAKHWPKLAAYFGTSLGYITTGSPEQLDKMDRDKRDPATSPLVVSERDPAAYGGQDADRVRLNPSFRPPAPEPTRIQIEEHFRIILDEAERAPGGLGLVNAMLRKHLDVQELKRLQH